VARLTSDKRQKNQLVLAFTEESRSEAPMASAEGTESLAAKCRTESPAIGEQWMEEVCERENCKQALTRVKANKGGPGVDGMTVHDLPGYLQQHWPVIRKHLSLLKNSVLNTISFAVTTSCCANQRGRRYVER
jgi:hypothetical protein